MTARKRPKGSYRYSIVPAGAITDPEITPRDLQVLCLLGRHTDDHGWCRRSQVKMGEELNCDRRTVQRACDRLVEAGYVQQKAEGRGGVAPPAEGEQPFAAYSYRVLLDLDDDEDGAQKCAGVETETVRKNAQGVRTQDAQGVRTSCAPLTEHSPCEDTPCEQPTCAREESVDAPAEEKPKPAKSVFDERIWPELRKVPGFGPNMRKASAERAFENIKPPRPATGNLVEAIRAWSRERTTKAKAGKWVEQMCHPTTWLHQRGWEGYLESADKASQTAADSAQRLQTLDGDHAKLAQEFGLAVYDKWFLGAVIERGPPLTLTFDSEFKAKWVRENFAGKLRRIFRVDAIATEHKREAEAA